MGHANVFFNTNIYDTDYSQGYQYSQPAQPGANNSYSGYNYGQTGYAGYDPYSSKI